MLRWFVIRARRVEDLPGRSFSESLRVQLADTNVQVIELTPPAVRTTLMNQADNPHAMPLDDFLSDPSLVRAVSA